MDKLDVSLLGGFPLDLNDLEWLQDAIKKQFKGIADAFGTSYVLSGCVVTDTGGSTYTITPGYVVVDGEIYEWEGAVTTMLAGGVAAYSFYPTQTLQAGGDEVFEDTSTQNAYVKRRATLGLTALGGPSAAATGPRIIDQIKTMLAYEVPGPWHIIDDVGEPAILNSYTQSGGADQVMFRKEPGGLVRFKGKLHASAVGTTNAAAFQLPATYRPGRIVSGILSKPSLISPVSGSTRAAYITPAGDFIVHLPGGADALDIFDLDSFPVFYAEN